VDSLAPYLGELHLHDNCGKQDEHLAMGKGNIDFQRIFKHLKDRRKDLPTITLEPHKEEDLWLSLEYLEKIWAW